jgi:uncharacterized protein (TIGR00369 family)
LRALMRRGFIASIGKSLDFSLIEVGDGRVVFAGTPGQHAYNPIGTIHGGYAATLLDSACGCALHSKLSASQSYATLELKVAYHRAMTDSTGPVRAEGWVVTLGRRADFTEARIVDGEGRLYATATSTLLVMDR